MAHFFDGLKFPIKRIVEFQPYSTLWDLVHKATRAERQIQEEAKYERTKGFFASHTHLASTPMTPKPSFISSPKSFSKAPHDTSPSLAVTKVLTTHSQDLEDQRCNIFPTKADIHGK
jgi:hypothetical protein